MKLQTPASVLIHPSQFPEAVEASMHRSLRDREMEHKFHYDTPKQTLRWLRLHEALSPARTDPDCLWIYESAFAHVVSQLQGAGEVEVVSLGCGGGQKDAQLLRLLMGSQQGVKLSYLPVDVSAGLALTARSAAIAAGVSPSAIHPLVMDLGKVSDWSLALESVLGNSGPRVVCFFGMLPNFSSTTILPRLAALLRPTDLLLLSANLAPGPDYAQGVAQCLPLYDNALTRDWLWSVMSDLGVERADARMDFIIRPSPGAGGISRIESNLTFLRDCRIEYGGTVYNYAAGELFRLFFSCRHTTERLALLLSPCGLAMEGAWCNGSGEEGVYACKPARSAVV